MVHLFRPTVWPRTSPHRACRIGGTSSATSPSAPAVGIVAGRSVTIGGGDGRFAIAPAPAPGDGAVSVTWLGAH